MRPAAVMEILVIAAVTFFNAEAAATTMSTDDRALVKNLYSEGWTCSTATAWTRQR